MTHTAEFVVNPRALQLGGRGRFRNLPDRVRSAGLPLWEPSTLEELEELAKRIALRRPSSVAIVGGDGTLRDVVSALHRSYRGQALPVLAFLPAGTVSTVVRNWREHRRSFVTLLELLLRGELPPTRLRPSLQLDLSPGPQTIGFMFGAGLVPRFFAEYEGRGSRGLVGAAAITAQVFAGVWMRSQFARRLLAPIPCELVVDGAKQGQMAYSLLTCSVIADLGLHFLVNYRAGEELLRPHLVASSLPAFALGRQALRVLRGKPLRSCAGFDGLASRFTVGFSSPTPIVVDGDVFTVDSVQVSAGPILHVSA